MASSTAGDARGNEGPRPECKVPDGKSSSRRSTRFKEENEYVEVTFDVRDGGDAAAVHSVKAGGGEMPEAALLAHGPAAGPGPGGLSSRLKTELRRIASMKRGAAPSPPASVHRRLDRSMTGTRRALRGLQCLNQSVVTGGWPEVEKRFERLAVDGLLLRSRFGHCIGMVGSEEFAAQIFDALSRRRGITAQVLTKDQLREFWEQLSDPGFDAKLRTFFDMVDKNADGQITEDELKEMNDMACEEGLEEREEYHMMVSKTFKSEDEAYAHYNDYAELKGFGIRKDSKKYKEDSSIFFRRRYVCCKGYRSKKNFAKTIRKRKPRPLSRCGCKAYLQVELNMNMCLLA